MYEPKVLALILAGGKGSRLGALTERAVKPALPFGGTYRLIDISLSNLAHSHISDVGIVQQYLPGSLNRHLANGRPWDLDRSHGGLRILAPYQGREGEGFASGNTDSIYRHAHEIEMSCADVVLVLSADHVYTLDFRDVLATHARTDADLTIVTTRIERDVTRYGVVHTDAEGVVTAFDYKPDEAATQTVACEVFCYDANDLIEGLRALAGQGELGDYGEDLVPYFVANHRVVEHRMDGYWLDLGTLQSYWAGNLQLLHGAGVRLDDPAWPIWTAQPQLLPARIEPGAVVDTSMVSAGARVAGQVTRSLLGPRVVVEAGAELEDCVVLDAAVIGPGVRLRNCVVVPEAQVRGGGPRGTADSVTLIGGDGTIAERDRLDPGEELPAHLL